MPLIARRQVVENLQSSMPGQDVAPLFARALREAGLKDKPMYTAEEVSAIGEAIMKEAQRQARAAMAGVNIFMDDVQGKSPG